MNFYFSNLTRKKYFTIFLFILTFLLILFVFFFVFYINTPPKNQTPLSQNKTPTNPKIVKNLYLIEKKPNFFNYWQEGNNFYYFNDKDELFGFNLSNYKKEKISSFFGIKKVVPSINGKKAVLFWEKNNQQGLSLFDIESKETKVLPINGQEVSFLPTGSKLIIYNQKDNSPTLTIFDIKKWKVEKEIEIPLYDINLIWLANNKVLLAEKPTCYLNQKAFLFDPYKNKITLLAQGKGLEYLVSPKRDKILFSFEKEKKSEIVSLDNKILARLKEFVLPEKCQFSLDENNLYCAIPETSFKNNCLPDQYWQGELSFKEVLKKIKISNLASLVIFQDNLSDIVYPEIFKNSLLFFDRYSGGLYYLKLK